MAEKTTTNITKSAFIKTMAEKTQMTQSDCEKAYQSFLTTLSEGLKEGCRVPFIGFGTFEVKDRAARDGRNPKTGEKLTIAARKAITFSAGKELKETVNG